MDSCEEKYLRLSASEVALMGKLAYDIPVLMPVLAEHIVDYEGEVIPYMLVSSVVQWMVEHREQQPEVIKQIFDWFDAAYPVGDDSQQCLISVGFVEMLPDPGHPGDDLRNLLSEQLREFDPWQ